MRTKVRRSGFTLLELMLSLGMVAMLAGGLYLSISVALRARETAAAAVAPIRSAMLAADLLRQDFESVLPPTGQFAGEFIGSPDAGGDTLEFYSMGNDLGWNLASAIPTGADALTTQPPWSDGIRHVELLVRKDVNPPVLVRRVTRNLLPTADADVEEEILCRNVKSFSLRYFDGLTWQDQWDSTAIGDALPAAVQVTMESLIESRVGQPARVYKVVRVFPLACAVTASQTGGTP